MKPYCLSALLLRWVYMHIIIHTGQRLLLKKNEKGSFLLRLFFSFAGRFPHYRFTFIAPVFPFEVSEIPKNIKWIKPPFSEKIFLAIRIWKSMFLPKLLKKTNADCFIDAEGKYHPNIKIHQLLFSDAYSFRREKDFKKFIFSSADSQEKKKFVTLIVPSYSRRQKIINELSAPEKNIAVIYPLPAPAFVPSKEEQKHTVKSQLSRDCEYFICVAPELSREQIIKLLKAFSIFKKRLKSNMKLVMCGNISGNKKKFSEEIDAYRFKEDVIIKDASQTDVATITASAYACIVFQNADNDPISAIESLSCHIPVIHAADPLLKEIVGEAGLSFQTDDFNDLAAQMMLVYKDEALHRNMIEACEKRKTKFSIEEAVRVLEALVTTAAVNE